MKSKKQRLGLIAGAVGVCAMGLLGWWVGGMGQGNTSVAAKPAVAVGAVEAAPLAPDTPMAQAPQETTPKSVAPAFTADAERLIRLKNAGATSPMRIEGGNLVIQGPGQPGGVQLGATVQNGGGDGPVKWLPPENTLVIRPMTSKAGVARPVGSTLTIVGNGTPVLTTVDAEGLVKSIQIDNGQNVNGNVVTSSVVRPAAGARPADAGKGGAGELP